MLGFYAKLFIINSIAYSNLFIALLAVITSVISSVRYLNKIKVSNFEKKNKLQPLNSRSAWVHPQVKKPEKDTKRSYIVSVLTLILTKSFINPIYLISTISYI